MRDRDAKRFAGGADWIDVDPLAVAGERGELVDTFLPELLPVTRAQLTSDELAQLSKRSRSHRRTCHCPCQTGFRFSANAVAPSRASCETNTGSVMPA